MSLGAFEIEGGYELCGEIQPQGAKNEALQVICACLLTSEPVSIHNLPNIKDVNYLIDLVAYLGVKVTPQSEEGSYVFEAKNIDLEKLQTSTFLEKARSIRGSLTFLGPLLARFHKAYIPKPGGDKIGRRRIDTHLLGFEKLGVNFHYNAANQIFTLDASSLKGSYILLEEASVTGTANIIMAATMAKGTTTIYNAACEPYLQQLCNMLNRMGAKISGIGSNLLTIKGVKQLGGTTHNCLPDMIEVGSFIGLAALTQSQITIKNTAVQHLGIIPDTFRKLGIELEIKGDDITIPKQASYEIQRYIDGSILTIADGTWPRFTPDLLSVALVVATQANGSVLIHQRMFESRLFFVDKLIDMGAQIILCDPHRAVVIGLNRQQALRGISMSSPDIRAGVALLMAALSAEGTSLISNAHQIDRGYQDIDQRLIKLGARIKRV
ncbi:MAG: UDP-N-acetylglucosamine 1-carboxyvinyltransferase [Chitinophagales bacterium]|nr:UDP-N-acetylglucosamine 1-carboxyvinyltransferase [Bacteroidota bacterium]MCB9043376.1 UDP-N-acetylglucosamine 1-carboxyvinyltransferase [Chitinophagales bacterium]